MKGKNSTLLKKAAGLFIAMLLTVVTAFAGDKYVSPGGSDVPGNGTVSNPYLTISYAVSQATAGDVIHVASGTYNEDVNINKQLTLLGAGHASTTVVGPIGGDGATMKVNAAGIIIDGFSIT